MNGRVPELHTNEAGSGGRGRETHTERERGGDAALLQRTAALPYCFLACEPLHGGERMGLREINARENEGEGGRVRRKGG